MLAKQASAGLNRIMSMNLSKANSERTLNTEEFLRTFQRYVDEQPEGAPMKRQYSSDLARLMSEFNNNPSSSDDFIKSFLTRTASELDALSQKDPAAAAAIAASGGGPGPAAGAPVKVETPASPAPTAAPTFAPTWGQ